MYLRIQKVQKGRVVKPSAAWNMSVPYGITALWAVLIPLPENYINNAHRLNRRQPMEVIETELARNPEAFEFLVSDIEALG